MSERLLTARELSERFGVSIESILRWHRAGRLPGGYRLATGVLRWSEGDVDSWLEGRREHAGNPHGTCVASSGAEAYPVGHE